jgi:hypothetical protein
MDVLIAVNYSDHKLYNSVKTSADKKFPKNSYVKNLWILKEYKKRGGKVSYENKTKPKNSAIQKQISGEEIVVSYCKNCDEIVEAAEEALTLENLYVPSAEEYLSAEEIDLDSLEFTELNVDEYFNIEVANAAEYQGRKVTLNKPFRTPDGPKKSAVYVKNQSGKVIIVRFGDKNMSIKKNIPARRRSFRARHKCDQAKDKTTPRYWACKSW